MMKELLNPTLGKKSNTTASSQRTLRGCPCITACNCRGNSSVKSNVNVRKIMVMMTCLPGM